jgi:hypothetical protein
MYMGSSLLTNNQSQGSGLVKKSKKNRYIIIAGLVLAILTSAAVFIYMMTSDAASEAFELCANSGAGKCLEVSRLSPPVNATLQPNIASNGYSTKGFQRMVFLPDNICNGRNTVTDTCPFKVGSGLNTYFKGNAIFQLHFRANQSYCLGVSGSGLADVESCLSKTTAWVTEFPTKCSSLDLLSVYETNITVVTPEYLTSSGRFGGPIYANKACGQGIGGYNQWGQVFK